MLLYDSEKMPPILPETTPVAWTYPEVMEAADSGVSEFVRRARLKLDTDVVPKHLNDALRLADMAIELTANTLGVKPIQYDWFLYPGTSHEPREEYDSSSHPLVPTGYSLVARVENVYPTVEPSPTDEADLATKISQVGLSDMLTLGDLNMGHVAFDPSGQGHLVDIDAEVSGIVPTGQYPTLLTAA